MLGSVGMRGEHSVVCTEMKRDLAPCGIFGQMLLTKTRGVLGGQVRKVRTREIMNWLESSPEKFVLYSVGVWDS